MFQLLFSQHSFQHGLGELRVDQGCGLDQKREQIVGLFRQLYLDQL